jgi:UDP-GlcNAc3NAcA epimerase
MPLHPRTISSLKINLDKVYKELVNSDLIKIVPPVSFLEMTLLEKTAKIIITDSGGVQKESHFFKKPCIVLRRKLNGLSWLITEQQCLLMQMRIK